jgi:hypothetical protein
MVDFVLKLALALARSGAPPKKYERKKSKSN